MSSQVKLDDATYNRLKRFKRRLLSCGGDYSNITFSGCINTLLDTYDEYFDDISDETRAGGYIHE